MTTENTTIQTEQEIQIAWEELFDLASSCIKWGESDIDKEKFISIGKVTFAIKIIE